jgi:dimethylhistidine N-methyltransferase
MPNDAFSTATGRIVTGSPATGSPATARPATASPATGSFPTGSFPSDSPPSDSPPTGLDPAVTRLALAGLLATPKTLPPQLFYDEEGCRLFYEITRLPEYYLTRTEWSLLTTVGPQIAASLPSGTVLVEYGASHEAKASQLLAVRNREGKSVFTAYVAIDVATSALEDMGLRLRTAFPGLVVHPVTGDFELPVDLSAIEAGHPRFGFFPGSTIGNLDPMAARRFLRLARDSLGAGALFLLGADLRKSAAVLLPAYDDAAGVTAAFNRNLLVRLNREAGATFDPFEFDHRAVWNEAEGRIEMHLVSRRQQIVQVGNRSIAFAEGETIHTENSYKFTDESIRHLAESAGWALSDCWFDEAQRFGLFLLAAE